MTEDLKETLMVQMFKTIKQLKTVVETQQIQLDHQSEMIVLINKKIITLSEND
jgi:hypothetical protein